MLAFTWDDRAIEKRKQRVRDVWHYRPVDHIPAYIWITDNPNRYSIREMYTDGEKQLEVNLRSIETSLRILPDDYIPWLKADVGYMSVSTMFGCGVYWDPENPDQYPGSDGPVIFDIGQMYTLRRPDPRVDGVFPELPRRMRMFRERTGGKIAISGFDLGGPLNTCKDLVETNLLYTAMHEAPEALHHLLDQVTDVQLECYDLTVEAAGGMENLTTLDFDPLWAPEGHKGFCSDDVSATISPTQFETFSKPYNNRFFQKYPGGSIHNCGPHPSIDKYLWHDPPIDCLNASFPHSRSDLPRIREAFAGRGLVNFIPVDGQKPDEVIADYQEMIEAFAPKVVGMFSYAMDTATYSEAEIRETYEELHRLSIEYARAMDWPGA